MILKQGDTYPPLQATIKDAVGTAVNLTGATVTLSITGAGGAVTDNAPVTVVSAAAGQIQYSWGAADTAQTGVYQLEFKIDYNDGRVLHVPNGTSELLAILPSIA